MVEKDLYEKMFKTVLLGEIEDAEELAKKVVERKMDIMTAVNQGYVKGMDEVGRLYQSGKYFLPELVASGEAMKAALKVFDPILKAQKTVRKVLGTVILGTVEGDIHDIGKSIVGAMMVASGFEVIDLGVNVSAEKFLKGIKEIKPNIVGLSSLLTTTMSNQGKIIKAIEEAGERRNVKIMVGGAAVTEEWAEKVGADAYGEDAITSSNIAKKLINA